MGFNDKNLGNKKDNLTIIYTPWSNLKKTKGMETGQVTFFKEKMVRANLLFGQQKNPINFKLQVKRVHIVTRNKEILNRLNKTKEEKYPDLAKEKLDRERQERMTQKEFEKKRVLIPKAQHLCSFRVYNNLKSMVYTETRSIGQRTTKKGSRRFEKLYRRV